jgi:nitrite reductase/ring-hydroxylating ferredoxin subunit
MTTRHTWHEIGAVDEFDEEEPRGVIAGGFALAVFRQGDEFFALRDLCSHEVAPLSEGFIEDGCVECPLHQGMFDLRTGDAVKEPCTEPVQTYPVRVVGEMVEVCVEPRVDANAMAGPEPALDREVPHHHQVF